MKQSSKALKQSQKIKFVPVKINQRDAGEWLVSVLQRYTLDKEINGEILPS